jgi:HAMP domain-containing protein
VSTVCFRVGGREFSIERHAAAIFATNLDKLSTGKLDGRAGAPSLLEKVDDVVVGNSHTTIELEGDEAEAAFYVLNVSIDAPSTEQRELAAALRRLRDESVRG